MLKKENINLVCVKWYVRWQI